MSRFLRLSLLVTAIILMIACGISAVPDTEAAVLQISVVKLTVEAQASTVPYNAVGQVINYNYLVQNTGTTPLAGPIIINDNKATALCPDLNTIGNKDQYLDSNESITCAGGYSITQADLNTGSVTSTAMARVGGIDSVAVNTVVPMAQNKVLAVTVAASPTSYNQAGQAITYTYVIKNTGAQPLGPVQFAVNNDKIPTPTPCGTANQILAPNETITCTATYTVSQADLSAPGITSTVTASGGSAGTTQPATITITNSLVPGGATAIPPSNIPRGSTVQHDVVTGEWLLQISRCYGADFEAVQRANPQVIDPDLIYPLTRVTVPNVGSAGTIYGKPCVVFYTVLTNDTWESIARKHNADLAVLREANEDVTLSAGKVLKVPINSAGGSVSPAPVPVREPIRLNLSAASPTVTLSGTIGTPATIRHVFTGAVGQILTVKLTVPTNDVGVAVFTPSGATLKSATDNTLSWSGTLTANGDHFIDLVSSVGTGNKSYTLEVTLTTPAPASPFEKVADINTGAGDSNPSHLTVFSGALYFAASGSDGAGNELWKYDSATKTASRVADTNAGAGGSDPAFLTPYEEPRFGNHLYFRANGNDAGGVELWRFHGTGTGRVTDLNSGPGDANPVYLTVFNGALYFGANGNDGKGVELWKYDGTSTTRVSDINPDAGDSSPAHLEVFNNALYFSATSNDGTGTELWKYDGTNTTRAADINPGVGNSNPAFLTAFNSALYFSANANDAGGTELWRFDGTTAARAVDINVGAADSVPTYLTVFNNALYFGANADNAGFELWKYDGTNVSRVGDLNTAGGSDPAYLTVYNNELYFRANGNDGTGVELWKFKGP